MKLFKLKDLVKSWSVQVWGANTALATADYYTNWLDALVPEKYKPLMYAVLGAIGLVARAIKQK